MLVRPWRSTWVRAEGEGGTNGTDHSDGDGKKDGEGEKRFTQADLDAKIKDRLDRERAKYKDYDELAGKAAELDKLKADGKSEADKVADRIAALEKEIADGKDEIARRDLAALRAKVGAKHKLPEPMWERIKGEDEAAMEADAKDVAKVIAPPPAPENDAGKRTEGEGSAATPTVPYRFQQAGDRKW